MQIRYYIESTSIPERVLKCGRASLHNNFQVDGHWFHFGIGTTGAAMWKTEDAAVSWIASLFSVQHYEQEVTVRRVYMSSVNFTTDLEENVYRSVNPVHGCFAVYSFSKVIGPYNRFIRLLKYPTVFLHYKEETKEYVFRDGVKGAGLWVQKFAELIVAENPGFEAVPPLTVL